MKTKIRHGLALAFMIAGLWLLFPTPALGYPVPPLPDDNLVKNPWFRSAADPSNPGLDGWVNILTDDGIGWGLSQKSSNPTSDVIVSGTCGRNESYCGTGARWANDQIDPENKTRPGLDVYLYQVIKADPNERLLKYFMYWVNHKVDIAEVTIYGGDTPDGDWTVAWLPFSLFQDKNPPPEAAPGRAGVPWFETGFLQAILEEGYPYYKIELHARYPEPKTTAGDIGVKITGVYFATAFTEAPGSEPQTLYVYNPSVGGPFIGLTPPGGSNNDLTPTPVILAQATQNPTEPPPRERPTNTPLPPTPTPEPEPTQDVLPPTQIVPTQVVEPEPQTGGGSGLGGLGWGYLLGLLTAGLIVQAVVIIRKVGKKT